MQFIGRTTLSHGELWKLSFEYVRIHGEAEGDAVSAMMDAADVSGDHNEHAKWVNVYLGITRILCQTAENC